MHGSGAGTFYYQLWVRSQPIMFCNPHAALGLSNDVQLTWPTPRPSWYVSEKLGDDLRCFCGERRGV
jgi:hypothetical protein